MAGNSIGTAYLQVVPKLDMKALNSQASSAGKSSGASFGKSFGGAFSGVGGAATKAFDIASKAAAAAAATAGVAIATIGKEAFDSYKNYEQLSGGISKLFGTAGQGIEEYAAASGRTVDEVAAEYAKLEEAQSIVFENAQQAYKNVGMSANDYMENISGFAAALTSSLGGDTVKAAGQAEVAMRAISDNVNTFGTDIDSVTTAFQGFAKQNYTMLDNLKLGYGGTKSEMERLIQDANAYAEANGKAANLSIDSFSDIISAIELIQEKQQIAGTTAREAGTTIEGSVNAAKAAWQNLLTEFGKSDGDVATAMENLVTTLVGDGTDENLGVFGNVIPRLQVIVENVAKQLPTIIAAVAPKVAKAFVDMLDSATGGLASKALEILSPLTETLSETFSGLFDWIGENQGPLSDVVSSLEEFAGVVSGALATAIEFVAPIIGDLASFTLPLLSGALQFVGGWLEGVCNLVQNLATAFSPLVDAIMPAVTWIRDRLADALTKLGDGMAKADFSEFAEIVRNALQGLVDFVGDCFDKLVEFFDNVGRFLDDPVKAVQDGFAAIVGSGEAATGGVSSSFESMDRSVAASLSGVGTSMDAYNKTPLDSKSADAKVNGNAADGTAKTGVDNTNTSIKNLQSKTVTATVNGNAKDYSVSSNIKDAADAIERLKSKTVDVVARYRTENIPMAMAAGGIRYHADGFIANRRGSGVPLDIVGEDGAEAIIPLTNKQYVRPFADTVAEQMLSRMGGMGGVTVKLNYDASNDANEIAREIAYTLDQIRRTGV